VVLTSTIVGGDLSMAPGLALAQKMGQGEPDGIVAVFFGNGAACEGIFHESLNLAVQRQLPLLFVSENNQWQAFVHRLETMPDRAIADWARSHGLPTRSVDGNAVDEVHAPGLKAVMPSTRADFRGLLKAAIRDKEAVLA
jgi:pyruvate dehydrogenase E1 component alpha subunit